VSFTFSTTQNRRFLLTVGRHKIEINKALKCAFEDSNYKFDLSFEIELEYRSAEESRRTCFVANHSIHGYSMDKEMRDWAKDQKLVPWVAVVAQISVSLSQV
jgi:sacsin